MLKFEIKIPYLTGANINRQTALLAGGRAGATWLRKRIRSGVDGNFNPIPQAKPRGKDGRVPKPMVDTKQLLNSIKAARLRKGTRAGKGATVTISPRGKDSKGVPNATKVGAARLQRGVELMKADGTMRKIIRLAINANIKKQLTKLRAKGLTKHTEYLTNG